VHNICFNSSYFPLNRQKQTRIHKLDV